MDDNGLLDQAELRRWIGRSEVSRDEITLRLAREFSATLDHGAATLELGGSAPLMIHWCLTPPVVPASRIAEDGHPERGGFLPPVALPRRMWAGGKVRFHDRLLIGDAVERRSTIADVTIKQGRSGTLCFVAVDHEIHTERGLAITERQDIVYRPMQAGPTTPNTTPTTRAWQWHKPMHTTPVTLFRYSAVTFNGHRIHYDRDYAIGIEHYSGLVVHGPLQATWMFDFATKIKSAAPAAFRFRGSQPLYDFAPFQLCARDNGAVLDLWIRNQDGATTMEAQATW